VYEKKHLTTNSALPAIRNVILTSHAASA